MRNYALTMWVGCVLVVAAFSSPAADATPTPEQIAAWVKQLGSDDFDVREQAEISLTKAGSGALEALKKGAQSSDPEIRTRSARIAEKLSWAVLPDISDLASVLPPDNIFFIGTPGAKDLITRIRKDTALGRLYDNPELVPLRDTLREIVLAESGLDDDGRKTVDQWLERFGGPLGLAFMRHDPEMENFSDRDQFAFFIGITDPDPRAAMNDFKKCFPLGGDSVTQNYRGVACDFQQGEWQHEGLSLLKNLIVRSNGKPALFNVIDKVMDNKQANLASADVYKEARGKVTGEPLGVLFFNMEPMFGTVFKGERDNAAATGLGFQEWKYAIVSLNVKDGLFVEQAYCRVDGERRGLAKLLSLEPVSGRLSALCPPDALLFLSVPTDGPVLYQTIMKMVETVDPREARQFHEQLTALEEQLNMKIMDSIAGSLKGEAALWLLRPQGADPTKGPETCLAFEAIDAAGATKVADTLARLLPIMAGREDLVNKVEYQGRTCYFMKPAETREPWEPELQWSWCADGARVLVGQRQEVLQQMLLRATQDARGLNGQGDYKRLLDAIPQDERGGLVYVNTAELLAWAYTVGLPALSADAPEDLKAKLEKAPKDPKALFKDLPGSMLCVRGTPDGVRLRAVGGVPATGLTMGVPFWLIYSVQMAMEQQMKAVPAQVQPAQGAVGEVVVEEAEKAEPEEKKAEKP